MDALQFKDALDILDWDYLYAAEKLRVPLRYIKKIARGTIPVPDAYSVWLLGLIDYIELHPKAPQEASAEKLEINDETGEMRCDKEIVGYLLKASVNETWCGYMFIGDPPGNLRMIGPWPDAKSAAKMEWARRMEGAFSIPA